MERSTHLTSPPRSNPASPRPARREAPGLGEEGSGAEESSSGGQVSALTMGLFIAGGGAIVYYATRERKEVVPSAPGPA